MEQNFITYYKYRLLKIFRIYDVKNNIFYDDNKLTINNFYLPKKYDCSDENLKKYAIELIKDNDEIKEYLTFDYLKEFITKDGKIMYRYHGINVETFFKLHQSKEYKLSYFEDIQLIENKWAEKCYNGAILHIKQGIYEVFGYDMKRYYQHSMKSDKFIFPYKSGEEMNYKKIPTNISLGYYNVKIHSNDDLFNVMFMYSEDDVYTSYSLKFCLKYQKLFNIQIELSENLPNAYIYTLKKACISGDKVFTIWSDKLDKLKEKYPNNGLIKMLSSSLHGQLTKRLKFHKTWEQIQELEKTNTVSLFDDGSDYQIIDEIRDDKGVIFKLIKPSQKYFHNIGRLQSFLVDFCRVKMMEIIISEKLKANEIIRIHTDGICTTRAINYEKYENFIIEEKSTGKFNFNVINGKLIRV